MNLIEIMDLTSEDLKALAKFRKLYPTWWYRIGVCDVTRDFTAAPQSHSPEIKYVLSGNAFDGGFACDSSETLAHAIEEVMAEISDSIAHYSRIPDLVLASIQRAFKNSGKSSERTAREVVEGIILDLDERAS